MLYGKVSYEFSSVCLCNCLLICTNVFLGIHSLVFLGTIQEVKGPWGLKNDIAQFFEKIVILVQMPEKVKSAPKTGSLGKKN